jgi:hypothetical protein
MKRQLARKSEPCYKTFRQESSWTCRQFSSDFCVGVHHCTAWRPCRLDVVGSHHAPEANRVSHSRRDSKGKFHSRRANRYRIGNECLLHFFNADLAATPFAILSEWRRWHQFASTRLRDSFATCRARPPETRDAVGGALVDGLAGLSQGHSSAHELN